MPVGQFGCGAGSEAGAEVPCRSEEAPQGFLCHRASPPQLVEKEGASESWLMEVLGESKTDQLPKVWGTWLQEGIGPLAEKTQGVRAGSPGGRNPDFGGMPWGVPKKTRLQHVPCMAHLCMYPTCPAAR